MRKSRIGYFLRLGLTLLAAQYPKCQAAFQIAAVEFGNAAMPADLGMVIVVIARKRCHRIGHNSLNDLAISPEFCALPELLPRALPQAESFEARKFVAHACLKWPGAAV